MTLSTPAAREATRSCAVGQGYYAGRALLHGRCSQTVANGADEGGFSRTFVEDGISRDALI